MPKTNLNEIIKLALEDLKGIDILDIDVREMTSIADQMILATGTSNRHVKALSRTVIDQAKEQGFDRSALKAKKLLIGFWSTLATLSYTSCFLKLASFTTWSGSGL